MKCVGLLVFVVLIQSVNKFIQLHRHGVNVNESNDEFDYDESAGDETPITVENGYKRDDDIGTSSETPSENSGSSYEHVDTSEKLENRGLNRSDDRIESRVFYEQHSEKVFPRICLDGLTEFMTNIVETFIASFSNLHSSLNRSTRYESSTLSAASTVLFSIVDTFAKVRGSTSWVLSSFSAILPEAFHSITEVVSGLNIQTLATQLSGAISALQKLLTSAILIVNDAAKLKFDTLKKLNAATILVAKSVEAMVNTLNVIAEATTKAIGSVSTEEQEAVISLSLVLGTVSVIVQSVFASIACVLSSLQMTSATLNEVLVVVDSALESIIGVITSTTNSLPGSMSVVIGTISMTFTQLANSLNSSLDAIQSSVVETIVSNSLEDLLNRISESVGGSGIASSISVSVTSVKSSINIVSTTSFGILPKVANQINPIFNGLSKVTGTDNVIVTALVNSFPSIFNSIKSASNVLVSGLGAETSEALNRFTEDVQLSLKSLLSLISGSTKGNVKIGELVQEIGKSVQHVAATVTSITSTISDAIARLSITVVEAILSLPFILSAVLYVTQWVLSVAVSIFASIAGSVSGILSKLTILISLTLEIVATICSTISSSASDSLVDIFNLIVPLSENLSHLVSSSFREVSGVVVNIVFNIDEILTGAAKQDKPIAGVLHGTEGCVLRVTSALTGKLGSISPSLSATLLSLNDSLKIGSKSDSPVLKTISNVLVLVLSQVTTVSGSASEILSLISNWPQYSVTFGRRKCIAPCVCFKHSQRFRFANRYDQRLLKRF